MIYLKIKVNFKGLLMQNEAFLRVEEAIRAIKKGEMVIIMDDEDRENEGDLVFAAEFCTAQKVNFMAQEARGIGLCFYH